MAVFENVAILQRGGYKEAPKQLAHTESPQQWRRPRPAMASELMMAMNWREVAEGRPDTFLPWSLYDIWKRVRYEEEQREAAKELARCLGEFSCSKSFKASWLESST